MAKNAWPNKLTAENANLKEPEGENALMEELEAEIVHLMELEADSPLEMLRAENAALKKQITIKHISRGEERKRMVEMLESSTSVLLKSKDELTSLNQLVESEKAKVKKLEKELRIMKISFKPKEEEVVSLNADLKLQEDKLRLYIHVNESRPKEIEEEHEEDVNSRLKEPEGENALLEELEADIVHLNEQEADNPLEKLRAENAALKKQITLKKMSWGEERKKMVEMLESSTSVLLKSKDELTSLIRLVESEKAKEKKLEKELRKMKMNVKVKEEEVVSLNADLKLQEDKLQHCILANEGRPEEIEEEHEEDVNCLLKEPEGENAHLEELEAEIVQLKELVADDPLEKLKAENAALKKQITNKKFSSGEERKKMVKVLLSSTSVLLKSKDELTSLIRLVESEKAKVKKLEMELRQMKMSFKLKEEEVFSLNADLKLQEDKLRHYILENEGRPEEIEELQKKIRYLDERWSIELEESPEKEIKLEDDIKLPIQQNIVIQALKTDSFSERVKKEKEKSGKEEKMERREEEEIEGTKRLPCFLFNLKIT